MLRVQVEDLGESYCSYGLHTSHPVQRPGLQVLAVAHWVTPSSAFCFPNWLPSSMTVSFWVLFLLLGIFSVILVEFQKEM